jgi:regulator of sirC expression with transglutaminase-like and TPR domain
MSARARFTELIERPESAADLAEAALWIAAEERAGVDPGAALDELEALAERVRDVCDACADASERLASLERVFFRELGFRGNTEDYHDPGNSDLAWVLMHRKGIPITLSLVFMEIGRRLGLEVEGVGFPGHFLVRVRGETEVLIDAFEGRVVSEADCAAKLRSMVGDEIHFHPGLLRACTPHEILARMLRNLKHAHLRRADFARALACCDRLLLLEPEATTELRDRGALFVRLECPQAALADFERYLALAPDDEGAATVRSTLESLREQAARLN